MVLACTIVPLKSGISAVKGLEHEEAFQLRGFRREEEPGK